MINIYFYWKNKNIIIKTMIFLWILFLIIITIQWNFSLKYQYKKLTFLKEVIYDYYLFCSL